MRVVQNRLVGQEELVTRGEHSNKAVRAASVYQNLDTVVSVKVFLKYR